ncbi:hypothetical protein BN1110_03615 [bacterium YEK0313]|nr:hypothetical protein BN1110_03615 [bacterium YEK0313]
MASAAMAGAIATTITGIGMATGATGTTIIITTGRAGTTTITAITIGAATGTTTITATIAIGITATAGERLHLKRPPVPGPAGVFSCAIRASTGSVRPAQARRAPLA